MSWRRHDGSDRSRPATQHGAGSSAAVLLLATAGVAAPMFYLAALVPNPVKVVEDVFIRPHARAVEAGFTLLQEECESQRTALERHAVPTTSPRCSWLPPSSEPPARPATP
jgi:hypothetical protein